MPHTTIADDWYEGVFNPKSTIRLPNMRLLNANTDAFGKDEAEFEQSLMIDLASLLWAMRFERPDGAQGELDTHTLVHSGVMT